MPPRRNAKKPSSSSSDGYTPMRPSEITGSASAHKPLIQLTEADLRAAGVTFHTGEDVAGKSAEAWIEGMGKSVRVPRGRIDEIEESGQDDTEGADEDEDGEDAEDADDEDSDDGRDSAMEAFWDEFFDALMWTVPFSFLYLMLDVLTNLSYSRHPAFSYYLKNYIMSTPTLGIIVFYTTRHGATLWCRALLTAASIGSGTRLVWLVNKASYLTVLEQGPAMGTLWILTIVQLPLSLAVAALGTVFAWLYQRGLKVIP